MALPLDPDLMLAYAERLARMPVGRYEQHMMIRAWAQRRHVPAQ